MTFRVNGIKQEVSSTSPLELLVLTDSSLLVRKLLEKNNILVLSIKEYRQEVKKFWDVYATIKRWLDEIQLVSNQKDIKTACLLFLHAGFVLLDINMYSKPLSHEATQTLLETCRQEIAQEKSVRVKQAETQKAEEKKIYADPHLAAAKEVLVWIFERTALVLERVKGTITINELKTINTLQEELKKLRMGNNYEKIKETGGQLLAMIQDMEDKSFVGGDTKPLIPGSIITESDIQKEELKQEYVLQFKKLGSHIALKNEDYAILGNTALFRKFFQKDLVNFFADPVGILFHLYDIAELCIVALLVIVGAFLIFNALYFVMDNLSWVYYRMMKFGCLGLLLFIWKYIKKQDIFNLILIYGATIIVYLLLTHALIANFAL